MKSSNMGWARSKCRFSPKIFLLCLLILAPTGINSATRSTVSVSGAMEPAFYSTGDYKSYMRSISVEYWASRNFGFSASTGRFEHLQDRVSWFTLVQVDVIGLEALFRSGEWRRQRLELRLGVSRQHKYADETFLEIASRDSVAIQKFQIDYMNTQQENLNAKRSNFRMRTAIRDEDGYYRVGISQIRDYSLYGASSFLTYGIRLFGDVFAQISPGVRYYPSEPLYIWSIGFGLNIPLLSDRLFELLPV